MNHEKARSGFTLVEVMCALVILSIAVLLSARLFGASLRSIDSVRTLQSGQASVDQMAAVLREDTWGAQSIEVTDSQAVVLRKPGAQVVRWRLGDQQVERFVNDSPTAESQWTIRQSLHAAREGAALIIKGPNENSSANTNLRFVSPIMAAEQWR